MIWTTLACPPAPDWKEAAIFALPILVIGIWLAIRLYRSSGNRETHSKICSIGPIGLYLILSFNSMLLSADVSFELANGSIMAFIFGLGLACRHAPSKPVQVAGIIHTSLASFLIVNLMVYWIYAIIYSNWLPRPQSPDLLTWLWLLVWLPFSIWLARRGYRKAIQQIAGRYCLKCDYDLRGSAQSTTCPECGEPIPPIPE